MNVEMEMPIGGPIVIMTEQIDTGPEHYVKAVLPDFVIDKIVAAVIAALDAREAKP